MLVACALSLILSHPARSKPPLPQKQASVASLAEYAKQPEGIIHLDVAVTNKDYRPVSWLLSKDFTLLDNGLPQRIISFRSSQNIADPNARLSEVILVLDQVYISPVQFAFVKRATINLLRQNGGKLSLPVSIYWFRRTGLYATAPSTNGNELADDVLHNRPQRELWGSGVQPRLLNIPPPASGDIQALGRWSGNLWDGALQSVYTIAIQRKELPGRKALLWFGPGWPNDAGKFRTTDMAFDALVELSTRIREARLAICQINVPVDLGLGNVAEAVQTFDYKNYVAGVRSLEELKKYPQLIDARFALPVLAVQSGGLIVDKPIESAIQSCVRQTSTFYTMSFNPPRALQPDEFHALQVQVPGVTARTSTGYYDEPVFYDQPRMPTKRISVQELERMLDVASKEHDSDLADQLTGLELTERLGSPDLARLMRPLGKKSGAALTGLADESAFLGPPAEAILADPAPTAASQHEMVSRTGEYLMTVLPRLPDFYATRTTVEYEQPLPNESDPWKTALPDQSLRAAVTVKATLRYRKGHEEQDAEKRKGSSAAKLRDLNLIGVFGPMLDSVLTDATGAGSTLKWTRWERGTTGKLAVFRFDVQGKSPFYAVGDCCLKDHTVFLATPPYHGEIAIDPESGAILRLTIESEPGWIAEPNLHPVQPVLSTSTMIEYGPVQIGTRKYICPRRSVEIMRSRPVRDLIFWDESFEIYAAYQTMIDDFSFTGYHKFGSDSRILPGFEVAPPATPPAGPPHD
jgi:VWFA-related protein